jgi:epsilon-lactone hydrolase
MSLRAELVRMVLRRSVKRDSEPDPGLVVLRQRFDAARRYFPDPPKGTKATTVDAGGVKGVRITVPQSLSDRHILYFHGGGYVSGSPAYYRDFIWRVAAASSAHVLCIYYRLSPEHPFPAALDDAVSAYSWLLEQGVAPARIAIMGDSAGGGLAFATLLRLREEGMPPPAAVVALSPWTDLAMTGESLRINASKDPMLKPERAASCARMYLAGADPLNPYASPLYGDPAGLPPALIQVGSDEILRDDSVRMADKLRAAGCPVDLEIWPRMPHVWQVFARVMPEARRAIERIGFFLQREMSLPARYS